MKCFYHNDADGKCAAFWVGLSAGLTNTRHSNDFIPMDYHKAFPFECIEDDEQVYIVDYSIPPEEMDILLKITSNVTWIDHHISAINTYANYSEPIRGVRYDGVAACMLAYCYLHHMTDRGQGKIKPFDISMTEDAPLFTKLLADWDVWKFDYGDDTRYFQLAFNAHNFSPANSKKWHMFLVNPEDAGKGEAKLITQGRSMKQFRDGWAKSYCKARGFTAQFEGYRCFAMNLGMCNSEYFNSISQDDYDILIPFSFDGFNWHYSLYSQTVDVSKIAMRYGGGGHRAASGFTWGSLLLHKG